MFIIDLSLKYTPLPLSVQRKTEDEAHAVYREIVEAMHSGNPKILELSCSQQPGKKISVLSSEITAVQVAEKSGAATGRVPGFFAVTE